MNCLDFSKGSDVLTTKTQPTIRIQKSAAVSVSGYVLKHKLLARKSKLKDYHDLTQGEKPILL